LRWGDSGSLPPPATPPVGLVFFGLSHISSERERRGKNDRTPTNPARRQALYLIVDHKLTTPVGEPRPTRSSARRRKS
jgi:hypothetical protein